MIELGAGDTFLFVIDTDSYAGNFEREMCAYITGQIGECGVGKKLAERAKKELEADGSFEDFDHIVISAPDEHGCRRPTTIYPNPNWFDGRGGHYRRDDYDPEEVVATANKSVEDYADHIRKVYADKEYAEREAQSWLDRNLSESFDDINMHPAYNSVAIFLYERPCPEMIDIMKCRARRFCEEKLNSWSGEKEIGIEGFRLVTLETVERSEDV